MIKENKYNLKVGDIIKIVSKREISIVSETGVSFKGTTYINNWHHVNTNLDNKIWEIVKDPFPENWKIRGSEKFYNFLKKSTIDCNRYSGDVSGNWYFLEDNHLKIKCYLEGNLPHLVEVTIGQLENYYLKKEEVEKIVGYKLKTPVAYLESEGSFEVLLPDNEIKVPSKVADYFTKIKILDNTEIFQPIYGQKFKVGDIVMYDEGSNEYVAGPYKLREVCSSQKGFFDTDGNFRDTDCSCYRYATKEEIAEFEKKNTLPIIDGFKPKVEFFTDSEGKINKAVSYGCVVLTKENLKSYRYLLTSEAQAEIKIKHVIITKEMIKKLLKALE